ncbi:hypothetical protein R1sor_015820 [Riccia sorocarpa]|uniref:Uncharacterized protein n=1 Tax=Riccia sorocarpa TaxID=122646 RepID=A0ABD3HF84_9MARC
MDHSRESHGTGVETEEDLWGGDDEDLRHYSRSDVDLQREWAARRNHFHTLGYRDASISSDEALRLYYEESILKGATAVAEEDLNVAAVEISSSTTSTRSVKRPGRDDCNLRGSPHSLAVMLLTI